MSTSILSGIRHGGGTVPIGMAVVPGTAAVQASGW